MNSKRVNEWKDIFAFAGEKEKIEHEADVLSYLIAQEIKRGLQQQNISSKEFARMIGTSPAYVTQVFRGDKRVNMVFLAKVVQKTKLRLSIQIREKSEAEPSLDEILEIREKRSKEPCKIYDFVSNWS